MRIVHEIVFSFVALAATSQALASSVCVSDTAGLRGALNTWQKLTDQTYTIKLVQGTYLYPNNDYWTQPYYDGNASLQLLGGYTAGCAARVVNATNTILDGQQAQVSQSSFALNGTASLLVEGITFRNFRGGDDNFSVSVNSESSDAADKVVVRYVIGHDLFGTATTQTLFPAFSVSGSSAIRVESSLFYRNYGSDTASALDVSGLGDNAFAIVTNVTSAYNGARGLKLDCFECSGSVLAYNNILYNNTAGDLDLRNADPSSSVLVAYSDFDPAKVVGAFPYTSIANFKADPQFENPLNNDFKLLAASPAINAGAPEFVVPGGYGSQDVDGGARVVGSLVDLGAYESAVDDLNAQTVTATTDNTVDQNLRVAITTANSNANATTIRFDVTGACPQVINLATPLPDITTDVTIDGFTQPGAKANTVYAGYDGQICVVLRASGTVDHALRVAGSGRLTVKGVEFEGFSTAAIRLAAGNGSIVTGNAFAAFPGSTANANGVRIEGTANHSAIGALAPNDRNVFDQGGVASAGVDFEANGTGRANVVSGNYFGFNLDGSAWTGAKLDLGIYLGGSGGNTISFNSIGNLSSSGIYLSGTNTTGNTIVGNGIGIGPDETAAGNGNAGIAIVSSAHGNVIGTATYATQSGGGNTIVDNVGPGVWVENGAGTGNRIDGNNAIHDNSGFLPVDLGAASDTFGLGPTANDNGDGDSGPNGLQNYPFLSKATRIEAKTIVVGGYLSTKTGSAQDYRIDVFWTDACVGSGPNDTPRGDMKRYVGFFFVPTDGSAFLVPWSNLQIAAPASIPKTGYLFATATDATGSTSEPGKCFAFTDDYIFTDRFE